MIQEIINGLIIIIVVLKGSSGKIEPAPFGEEGDYFYTPCGYGKLAGGLIRQFPCRIWRRYPFGLFWAFLLFLTRHRDYRPE